MLHGWVIKRVKVTQIKYVSNFLSVTLKALQTKINLRGVSTDIWLDAHTMLYNYK
jgi:hypothetical protein